MKNHTRFLSGTALVTLGLIGQLHGAGAQVFVGSGQPSVEVNMDALNDLPGGYGQSERIVRLHEPKRVMHHGQVTQYNAGYADATTVVSSRGIIRTALAAPDAPDTSATSTQPAVKPVAHHHHHKAAARAATTTSDLNRRSLTEPGSEGLNPEIAKFDPAVMSSADLNRLQILCSAIPTSAHNPMENASFTPAPVPDNVVNMPDQAPPPVRPAPPVVAAPEAPAAPPPVAPEAAIEPKPRPKPVRYVPPEPAAVVAPSPKETTASLNQKELALDTLGNADIPPAVAVPQPPAPPANSYADNQLQQPVNTPPASHVDEQPMPTAAPDTQLAAIPAPPAPLTPDTNVQPVAMAPAPTPHAPPAPLDDGDLRVDFMPGEAIIPPAENAKLDKVVDHMTDNSDLRIELRAFATSQAASTSMARRVSLARALAIKSYLTSRGIPDERIDVRALGSSPTDASDRVDLFLMR